MELRKRKILVQGIVICFILISCPGVRATEPEKVTLEDRIVRLEIKIEKLETKVDEGFKRVDERIDGVEKRIDDLRGLIYVMLAGMVSLVGFILWDRRTTIAPVVREVKEVVKQEGLIIDVLKRYAQFEPKMAQAIKAVGL